MNLLSGVTWKGSKLRIGEAKSDFGERCVFSISGRLVLHIILDSPRSAKRTARNLLARNDVYLEAFKALMQQICRW